MSRIRIDLDNDGELTQYALALSREGFELPFMARSRDYPDHEALHAADEEAWRDNLAALRAALTHPVK